MDMIEVDPKLFVTCRLCLEEIGVYQIVPEVQKKIKYCFDLDISLFDGLPQLICKKCESMLSHHALIKEMLHEKQKSLLIKLKGNIRSVTVPDLQKPSSSIPQSDAETEILVNYIEKSALNQISTISKGEINCTKQTANKSSCNNIFSDAGNNEHLTELKRNKSLKNRWRKNYSKQFVCKFCSLSLRHKTNIILHGEKCALMKKYSNMLKWCWVKLQNLNFTPNLTDSKDNVVWEKNKIINSKNPNYYILYSLKTPRKSVSESSDENFTSTKKKRKRQRLMSVSSNETLVIDGNSNKENSKNNCIDESDIECVTLDDSDTASTLSTFVTKHDNLEINAENVKNQINEKMINNIVSICYNKYLKRLNVNVKNVKNYGNHDSFLQRKLLSMGRKIIHKEGFNPTGLLRYMEQKDLDVVWIEKTETNVSVRTTFKENKGDELADIWKSLNKIDNNYKNKDFIDNFEKLSTSEADSTNSNLVFTNEVNTQDEQNVISSGIVLQQNVLFSSGNDSSPLTFSSHNSKNIKSPTGTYSKNNEKLLGCMYDKKIENNVLYLRAPKESENNTMLHKILNANPVPNPKKLSARNLQDCLPAVDTTDSYNEDEILRDKEVPASVTSEKESLHMPIITSTVSLAPNFNNQITSNEEQCSMSNEADTAPKVPEQTLPRIKVKPVSELMADVPTHPKGIPTTASVWAGNFNENQNVYLQNIAPNIQLQSVPVYMSMVQPVNSVSAYPQIQAVQLNNITQGTSKSVQRSRQEVDDREYILMHTVELPQKKTQSPFQYFKDLLNIHKFELLNNAEAPTLSMSCIVKFKLVCEQGDIAPVTLCLSLLCDKNTFCIQVMDVNFKLLNVNDFSANWQWEILKAFRGNVVQPMLLNAKKFGQEMFDRIQYFTLLLSTIIVSRLS